MIESLEQIARRAQQKDDRKQYAKGVKKHGSKKFSNFIDDAKDDRDDYKEKMKYGKHGR